MGKDLTSEVREGSDIIPVDQGALTHPQTTAPKQEPAPLSGNAKRASDLKARYPDLEGIPDRISLKKAQKMVADHTGSGPQSAGVQRAKALKENYPDMGGIPKVISKRDYKQMVAVYEAQKSVIQNGTNQNGTVGKNVKNMEPKKKAALKKARRAAKQFAKENVPTQLPQRPRPVKQQAQQSKPPVRSQAAAVQGPKTGPSPKKRPVSNKMAPLSDARRAEVTRNLSGASNDDPITLD